MTESKMVGVRGWGGFGESVLSGVRALIWEVERVLRWMAVTATQHVNMPNV
jgi:hypothetical protein